MFGWPRRRGADDPYGIRRLARAIESTGLVMRASDAELAEAERALGRPVPEEVVAFLRGFPDRGARMLDPEGHAQRSSALRQLLMALDGEVAPAGIVGPSAGDLAAGRNWWYLMFHAKPGTKRFPEWEGWLGLRFSQGEEGIAQAEARYATRLPDSYRRLLAVFDHVAHSGLHMHEGVLGPRAGAGVQGFEGELDYIRMWLRVAGRLAEASPEQLEAYLPFYADPYGNEYLFARRSRGTVFRFDHETCGIGPTPHSDFDAFFAALLAGRLGP
ncbi:MAG: SMI1/KNR4 family protein [Planctomycetes bacterium]|nr:SMI1/KNR4 family protein [Planctomycetota bacterium]